MDSHQVLIVEDDNSIGRLIKTLLIGHGLEAEIVTDGLSALQRLQTSTPALVVLDLALPLVDGWEILTTLQQAERDVAVIVVTAHGNGEGALRAAELGAERFFEKPFEPSQFISAVEELLGPSDPAIIQA